MECGAYLAFGMPIAMLGAGWPDARHTYDRPSSALGLVALAYGLGRLATSPSGQAILRRWSIGAATAGLLAILAVTNVLAALTGSFALLVGAFAMVGLVSGALDSLGNRYQTVVQKVGQAGLMFGAYGIGATLGPALVALTSWTTAYLAAAVVAGGAALLAASPAVGWPHDIESPATAAVRATRADRRDRPPIPTGPLVVSLLCIGLYVSLEVSAGSWTASYFEEHRGASAQWAGLAVSGFWGGVTLSRLVMGRYPGGPHRIMAVGATAVAAAYISVPFLPLPLAMGAVLVAGGAGAVMFPTLVATTTERVGAAAAARVTGYQLLAANLVATGISAAIGVIVARTNDGAPIWVLIAVSVVALPLLFSSINLRQPTTEPVTAPLPAGPRRAMTDP